MEPGAPVAHIKFHKDLCPFQLVSDHLWVGDVVPGCLGESDQVCSVVVWCQISFIILRSSW